MTNTQSNDDAFARAYFQAWDLVEFDAKDFKTEFLNELRTIFELREAHPHHLWGDQTFDWNGLNDAAHIVHDTCKRWARLGIHVKEKYGTLRASTWWWQGDLHSLIYPGYVYCQYHKKWWGLGAKLWWCDVYVFPKIAKWTGLLKVGHKWQALVYNYAYQKALKKYPKLKNEILVDADVPGYIKGGQEVHDKFWTKVEA